MIWAKFAVGFFAQSLLITAGYILFYVFPVHIKELGRFEVGTGFWDTINYQFVHRGMTRYAAFPSMHVANAWFCAYLFKVQNLPGAWIANTFAYLQFIDTLLTRAHFILDIPAGWLLAELMARFMLIPLERSKCWNSQKPLPLWFLIGILVILHLGIYWLSVATGWTGMDNFFK